MTPQHSWSLIYPKPVTVYVSSCDDHIVYWNGLVMPHKMALGTRAWDHRVSRGWLYPYLCRIMRPHVEKITENRPAQEILAWFDLAKSRVTDTETQQL